MPSQQSKTTNGEYNPWPPQSEASPEDERLKFYLRQLAWYERATRAGSILALYESFDYCLTHKLEVQDWMMQGAMAVIELLSPFNQRKKRGRATHPIARNRQDLIHISRYYAVSETREYQASLTKELKHLREIDGTQREIKQVSEMSEEAGTTWLDAYETAARSLRGTAAFASSGAVKRSYLLVKKHMESADVAPRYFIVGQKTLHRLGIKRL